MIKLGLATIFASLGFLLGLEAYPEKPEIHTISVKPDREFETLSKQYKWVSPKLYHTMKEASIQNQIPITFIAATVRYESEGNVNAHGPRIKKLKGMRALGLMQVLPSNYKGKAKDLLNPEINIKVGSKYLAYCYRLADGDIYEATKNYNSGPNSSYYNHPHLVDVLSATVRTQVMIMANNVF
jgi:soluble lytic murein transglycosylase-like protein